ncbi:protein ITPRID2 [Aethina tumida]|uniref:protein ITPRID2 n=1 Tax=Aethina tumida TaxID=116153 RepID=UPI00096B422A|nr:protein ITPRID2 [Aethina tumida]XP_019879278.1 protein ITPRID2 [Aethina tumida]
MDRQSTIQQWIDTLPASSSAAQEPTTTPAHNKTPVHQHSRKLLRDISLQSDDASSHCSSVESVLELRKPDPEAVLLGLGFGPSKNTNIASRIPQRFLQPSKLLTQLDINKFLEQYGNSKYNSTREIPERYSNSNQKYAP